MKTATQRINHPPCTPAKAKTAAAKAQTVAVTIVTKRVGLPHVAPSQSCCIYTQRLLSRQPPAPACTTPRPTPSLALPQDDVAGVNLEVHVLPRTMADGTCIMMHTKTGQHANSQSSGPSLGTPAVQHCYTSCT